MDKTEAIEKAVDALKGRKVKPGTVVACRANRLSWKFVRYEGEKAIVTNGEKEMTFPSSEVFDVNEAKRVAQIYYTFGYWDEKHEPLIVAIGGSYGHR